jgi:hypothetical protein
MRLFVLGVLQHVLAWALHKKEVTVPARCEAKNVGKRKAPAGASLSKRTRALIIDNWCAVCPAAM